MVAGNMSSYHTWSNGWARSVKKACSTSLESTKKACSTSLESTKKAAYDTWITARRATENTPYNALGLGLTYGSAYVCAKTVTPYLVSLNQVASTFSAAFFQNIPVFGPICQALIGSSGILGVLSLACVLGSLVGVLVSSPGSSAGSLNWALLHVALGLSISPYLLGGLTLGTPLVVLLAVCQVALTVISTQKVCNDENYWQRAAYGLAFAGAMAPVASQLSLGISALMAVERIGYILGSCAILCSLGDLYMNMGRFWDPSTPLADACLKNSRDIPPEKLDMEGDGKGTVFGLPTAVINLVKAVKVYLQEGNRRMGLQKLLLHGKPGTGKTITATAIANELNAMFFVIKPEHLSDPSSGMQSSPALIAALFKEIRQKSRYYKRPAVVFMDEGDAIFTNRKNLGQQTAEDRTQDEKVTAFLSQLDGLDAAKDDNMLVITATNHAEKFDESIRQRFLVEVELKVPNQADCTRILTAKIGRAFKDYPPLNALANSQENLATLAQTCVKNNLVGRHIDGLIQALQNDLYAERLDGFKGCWTQQKFIEKLANQINDFIGINNQIKASMDEHEQQHGDKKDDSNTNNLAQQIANIAKQIQTLINISQPNHGVQ